MNTRRTLLSAYSNVQTAIFAVGVSLLVVLAYALSWVWLALQEFPFGIPGTFYLLGGLAALQLARWRWIDSWIRHGATVGTLVGFVVAIDGLGATAACPGAVGRACSTSLNPDPLIMLVGLGMMTTALYLDIRVPVGNILQPGTTPLPDD